MARLALAVLVASPGCCRGADGERAPAGAQAARCEAFLDGIRALRQTPEAPLPAACLSP